MTYKMKTGDRITISYFWQQKTYKYPIIISYYQFPVESLQLYNFPRTNECKTHKYNE